MGKRQEAALKTRGKLVEAMRELLLTKSADEINIEDITALAGVAKGSFYSHFRRKEDVISVVAMEQYNAAMTAARDLNGKTGERIAEYLRLSADIIAKYTLQVAQNWMKSVVAPLGGETAGTDKYRFDYDNILELLNDGAARGEIKPNAPLIETAKIIMNAYYGTVAVWCISNGKEPLVENMEYFCGRALKAILGKIQTGGGGEWNG